MLCGMLRRERWADLVDSDLETSADFDAADERSDNPRAWSGGEGRPSGHWSSHVTGGRRCMPFFVLLGAYVRGLLQGHGSRDSMIWLQSTLQQDARAQFLRPFILVDLVFWISFDPSVVRDHVRGFALALRSDVGSQHALRLWQSLLQIECRRCEALTGWDDAFCVWGLQLEGPVLPWDTLAPSAPLASSTSLARFRHR